MFQNVKIGILLYISHILSSIFIALILSKLSKYNKNSKTYTKSTNLKKSHLNKLKNNNFNIFSISVVNTIKTCANMFCFMCIFNLLGKIICNALLNVLNYLPSFNSISILKSIIQNILPGIFEITTGIFNIQNASLNIKTKIYITSFTLSFSSLMIIFQLYIVAYNCKIKFKKFTFWKSIQGIISTIITYILLQCMLL